MKLIVGLGNPGEKFINTRHNLGFMVVDEYVKKHLGPKIIWESSKDFKSEMLKLSNDLWLVKPQTFMNHSGVAVENICRYYKINPSDLIVIYDDLDLPLGKIKIRMGGSAAGHHGVESILERLGKDGFIRIRIGIGNLKSKMAEQKDHLFDANRFVVDDFDQSEKSKIRHAVKQSINALDVLIKDGLEKVQTQFN
ncbi:aminoacyl-tRNA hydrolase [Candidatus Daviesbacteria bacterium RIFCSPHIGHO2_02_FULL_41_14]|uniref:Peptidyl-tRNA hydrolase n=1 Tax=Candidatus Daviesbacteria bacterium RIFCSPLOWO2_01_FULL_40_24 TaxID=1797787 RepID=A0A1F5MIQ9_9BACT|nr:MAG: aminoacyl-tRNA hydrolase [Candidatus Daviesbacteria bacterium RIFCSPHIGHO2_01_FULL_41_45]OGE34105.1 MAG: aminoacyl-tRNA hydrolase [Candidatus Daviesbacteria bacterium RIFCSPHIGHO2_02_FULL_41_14]OGE65261.1 MAG: aminoacyl-tRNA hydrolase [Candidatus Daviesbacteria bacterium RIFCSPLOWO2_01_FULL_40_24]